MAQMAGLFQGITGRVGEIVYYQRGGKTFIRRRPRKRGNPPSEQEKARQAQFAITGRIAREISMIDELKYFWKPIRSKNQTNYNLIVKANYNKIDTENLKGSIILSPDFGFSLTKKSISIGNSEILMTCDPLITSGINYYERKAKYIVAAGVILMKNPQKEDLPGYDIISFRSKRNLFSINSKIRIVVPMGGVFNDIFRKYSIKKVFTVFIVLDKEGIPIKHSTTMFSET
jgi:hypothetical protein